MKVMALRLGARRHPLWDVVMIMVVAVIGLSLGVSGGSTPSGYDSLYCNPVQIGDADKCCIDDKCYRCFEVQSGSVAVSTPLGGVWALTRGTATGINKASNIIIPAPSDEAPPGVILTANMTSEQPVSESVMELVASKTPHDSDIAISVTVQQYSADAHTSGIVTLSFGGTGTATPWRLEIKSTNGLASCIKTYSNGTDHDVADVDMSLGGKLNVSKSAYVVTAERSKNLVNITVSSGTTTVGSCMIPLSDTSPSTLGSRPTLSVTATTNSALAVVVTDVQISDNQLPKRAPAAMGSRAEPLAFGSSVVVARGNGSFSDSLLLLQYSMAVAVISIQAELATPVYKEDTGTVQIKHSAVKLATLKDLGQNSFVQTYDIVEAPGLQAIVHFSVQREAPTSAGAHHVSSLINANVSVVRDTDNVTHDVLARVTVMIEPTDAPGMNPMSAMSFASVLNAMSYDPDFDVAGVTGQYQTLLWGTFNMAYLPGEVTQGSTVDPTTGKTIVSSGQTEASIPTVALRGSSGGVMAIAGARSTFVFQVNRRHLKLSRVFFLPAGRSADSGYFNGDVHTVYSFSVALISPNADWADMHAVYREVNPWLSSGRKMSPPGTMAEFANNTLPETSDTARIEKLRVRICGHTLNEFWPIETQTPLLTTGAGEEFAKDHGVNVMLWSNVRMSPNVTMCPWEDPLLDFHHFADTSAVRNGSGALLPCWDGFSMNPSADFPFGQYQVQRIMGTIEKYNLSGLFFDLYGDTTDSDSCRRYEQFPFYPLQVAEVGFIKTVGTALHKLNRDLVVNCPHPSIQLRHLIDAVSCDSNGAVGNCAFSDSLSHHTAGRPSLLLRNTDPNINSKSVLDMMLAGVFYGTVPNLWQAMSDPADQPVTDDMVGAALPLAFRLAEMDPAGGSFADGLWWADGHRDVATAAAITLRVADSSQVVKAFNVSLTPRVTLADSSTPMSILLWDGVAAYFQLATGSAAELTTKAIRLHLGPGMNKALLYVPATEAASIVTDYGYL